LLSRACHLACASGQLEPARELPFLAHLGGKSMHGESDRPGSLVFQFSIHPCPNVFQFLLLPYDEE